MQASPTASATSFRDVVIFAAGVYADGNGGSLRYGPEQLRAIARNCQHVMATRQGSPSRPGAIPLVIEHEGVGVVGWAENVRANTTGTRLLADFCSLLPDVAEAFRDGRLLGHSVEIGDAEASNYRGIEGPLVKRIALLTDSMPRVKVLGSQAYAEFELTYRPGRRVRARATPATSGALITFAEEGTMPDTPAAPPIAGGAAVTISLEAILAWLQEDPKRVEELSGLLGKQTSQAAEAVPEKPEEPDPAKLAEEEAAKAAAAKEPMMAELRALRAELRLLSASQKATAGTLAAERKARATARFSERERELSIDFGPAAARDVLIAVRRGRADESFSEADFATIETEIAGLTQHLPRLRRAPGTVGQATRTASGPRTIEAAIADVQGDARFSDFDRTVLLNPAFADAVKHLAQRRLEESA